MEYVTKLVPRGGEVVEIESNDPQVVSELERVAGTEARTREADRTRFEVPAAKARLHFPHLFDGRAA